MATAPVPITKLKNMARAIDLTTVEGWKALAQPERQKAIGMARRVLNADQRYERLLQGGKIEE